MAQQMLGQRMEQVIRAYIQACNAADAKAIAACFCPDGVHYFPVGNPRRAKWVGAAAIGSNFAKAVQAQGVCWTVDQVLTDVDRHTAALEWTRFDRKRDQIVRGVDWFVFEPRTTSIQEVRTYRATPIDPDIKRQELQDFDYSARGYPMT